MSLFMQVMKITLMFLRMQISSLSYWFTCVSWLWWIIGHAIIIISIIIIVVIMGYGFFYDW